MANILTMTADGDSFETTSSDLTILGTTGNQTVKLAGSGKVTTSAAVERVEFAGNLSQYTFKSTATGVQALFNGVEIANVTNGQKLVFADGSASVATTFDPVAGTSTVKIGNASVTSTAAPITATNAGLSAATGETSTITSGPGGTSTSTTPTFSVAAGATSVTEGGNATFTVTLSAAQGTATTVNYALAGTGGAVLGTDTGTAVVAGTNVTSTATTLTFAPGATTATITVPVTFDANTETGEGASLTLTSPSTGASLGANAVAVTAFADPAAPTFAVTSNATAGQSTEEGKTITYTITPSGITDKAYTFTLSSGASTAAVVGATAAASADFTPASTTITFAAGTSTAQTVVQTVYADGTTEGLESYSTVLLDSNLAAVATLTGLISDATGGTATGSTFSLTTGTDVLGPNSSSATLKTTTGGDSIYGLTAASLTSADIIDAGTGTDVLIADYDHAADNSDYVIAPVLTSVEEITIRNTGVTMNGGETLTFDAVNSTGITKVTFDQITGVTAASNAAAKNLGSGVELGLSNNKISAHTYTYTYTDAALAGTADTVKLNVTGSNTATGAVVIRGTSSTTTGAGAETLNIITSGTGSSAASTLASVLVADGGGATPTLKTLNVSGTSNLTITGSVDFAGTTGGTISATGMSGNLTLTANTGPEPITFTGGTGKNTITVGASNNTLTGGSNDDTFNLVAGVDSVTGGAGNDEVVAAIASLTALDTIVLGDGTRDGIIYSDVTTLNSTGVIAANLTVLNAYTGVEVVGSSAAVTAIDAGYFNQSIYKATAALTAAVTVTNVAGDSLILTSGLDLGTGGTAGDALTVSGALPNQTFTLELNGAAAVSLIGDNATAGNTALTIASGISTVNLVSTTTSTTAVTNLINTEAASTATNVIDNVSAGSFVLTGATDLTISGGTAAGAVFSKAVDFNASAFTGKLSIGGSLEADVIKGGSLADTINGDDGDDVLTGNGGADTFVFISGDGSAAPSTSVFETITDFAKSSDIIDWDAALTLDAAATAAVAGTAQVSATGIATFHADDDTFAERIVAATKGMDADGDFVVFQFGSDSYVYISGDANATQDAPDALIKLTGVTGLTVATVDASNNILLA